MTRQVSEWQHDSDAVCAPQINNVQQFGRWGDRTRTFAHRGPGPSLDMGAVRCTYAVRDDVRRRRCSVVGGLRSVGLRRPSCRWGCSPVQGLSGFQVGEQVVGEAGLEPREAGGAGVGVVLGVGEVGRACSARWVRYCFTAYSLAAALWVRELSRAMTEPPSSDSSMRARREEEVRPAASEGPPGEGRPGCGASRCSRSSRVRSAKAAARTSSMMTARRLAKRRPRRLP